MPRLLRAAVLPLLALALAACDSGTPVNPPSPADVAGTYTVADFRFRPQATALPVVVVSDTLVAADTFFELLDSGQALFRYRKTGGAAQAVSGTFEVRAAQVRLTFPATAEAQLGGLLLPRVLTFDRDGTALILTPGSASVTANLNAYDPVRFSGFTSVPGAIQLRLVRRT
ncbi:MAG: hypothetical protein ACK41D_11075 [Rubricoccaceae bacterium]